MGPRLGRYEVITTTNSFHGRTMATLSATGQEKIQHGFEPLVPGFVHVPYNDLAAVEAAITPKTAAILVEGIQGEGGVYVATPEYLLGLRKLADAKNLLLLMDGVQCGYFRTGRWQSYQRILEKHARRRIVPARRDRDGQVARRRLSDRRGVDSRAVSGRPRTRAAHGTTYGGSPLACAVALKVLDVVERRSWRRTSARGGDELIAGLNKLVGVRAASRRCAVTAGSSGSRWKARRPRRWSRG